MATYLLAHDLGTTGNKATLFTAEGELVKSVTCTYPLAVDGPCAEQNAEDWWQAVIAATKTLTESIDPADIAAISFSGQMMGCLCLDGHGNPLRPAIIWADIRSKQQENDVRRVMDDYRYYLLAGHRLSPSYSATKLAWIRDNEPDVYRKTDKMIHAKDYILYKLTGNLVSEVSDASSTCLLDINTLDWSDTLIKAHGLDKSKLPPLLSSVDMAGRVTKESARLTGLLPGTPVICGGGDGPAAAVGSGAVKEGRANLCLGTSSWISFAADAPLPDPAMTTFTFAHMVKGKWLPTGTMQTGGGALSWAVKAFFDGAEEAGLSKAAVYERVNKEVNAALPGAEGLLFLPYLMGERSPRWNSQARGCFLGLSLNHGRGELLRAVMEGVAYNLDVIRRAFVKNGAKFDSLMLMGGGARNAAWQQILSDVLELPVRVPVMLNEATSMGAAVTAGVGVGLYDSFDVIDNFLTVRETRLPQPENHAVYERAKEHFDEAYAALCEFFAHADA